MKGFIKKYLDELKRALDDLNTEELSKIIDILQKAHENKRRIFVMGNGGSAATANHFTCDFGKNAIRDDERRIKIISLSDNISYITAYGNDIGYEYVFIEQLKNLMESGDIVVAISASGNSPNIIKAVEYAKEKGGVVIGLTGGKGGKLKELADIGIVANINTYEQIEDIHMIITHIIVFLIKSHY